MARRDDRFKGNKPKDEFTSNTININRVTKVVKGGRNMRFSALVVVGDDKGRVGLGMGKAAEVPVAIEKAIAAAKRNLITVPIVENTIPHEAIGRFGRGKVLLLPAVEGTGVIAGGPVRAIMEACGIANIRTKSIGTSNSINCSKATIEGLKMLRTIEQVARLRNKTVEEITN